jgi:hypothetical protein
MAVTGNRGFGIWLVVGQPLEHVTLPVTPAGDVCPSPVIHTWTMLPADAGFEVVLGLLSEFKAAAWPIPVLVAVKIPGAAAII